jgi:hypothetical protein
MTTKMKRSIAAPMREGLSWEERWRESDKGLIWSWELGREKRLEEPELAERAVNGELVTLVFKGGTERLQEPEESDKKKSPLRLGAIQYLAMWKGLRNEDLDIDVAGEHVVVCSRTKRSVTFRILREEDFPDKDADDESE